MCDCTGIGGGSRWMNEQAVCEWLGVSKSFMIKYSKEVNLNVSYLKGNRVKMYDRTQIEAILDSNSLEKYIQETHK